MSQDMLDEFLTDTRLNIEGRAMVRSVDRALQILLSFDDAGSGLTVSDLLDRVQLTRPTLYRLLYTLEDAGFLVSMGEPRRFSLGPAIARLAWAWSANIDINDHALPIMRELWNYTGETIGLFIAKGSSRICVSELPSASPLSFKLGVGHDDHIALGASSRALLAWSEIDDSELHHYCQKLNLDYNYLVKQLEEIRKSGFSCSHDELIEGAGAIAVPIFGFQSKIIGVFGIYGPSVRMQPDDIDRMLPEVFRITSSLSLYLGDDVKCSKN